MNSRGDSPSIFLLLLIMLLLLGGAGDSRAQDGITQSDFPETIRVLRTDTGRIETVDFMEYVKNVLPNEWIASWDIEALKAGAMAVKTYGWYRVLVAKYPGQGYDARDDTADQVYAPGSSHPRTDQAVEETWDWVMTRNGDIFEAQYDSGTPGSPDPLFPGRLSQWGTQYWAELGRDWQWMLRYYYDPIEISLATGDLDADLNNDNTVDVIDLGILLSNWNSAAMPPADINQDGIVDAVDLDILLSNWGGGVSP